MSRCYDEQFVQDNSDVCSSVYAVQEAVERLIEVVEASKPVRQQDRFIQFPTAIFREQQFNHCTIGNSAKDIFYVEVILITNEAKIIYAGSIEECDDFVAKAKILGSDESYKAMIKHNENLTEKANEAK